MYRQSNILHLNRELDAAINVGRISCYECTYKISFCQYGQEYIWVSCNSSTNDIIVYVLTYHRQIFFVKDQKSATMQDQSQCDDTVNLYWFRPSCGVTTLHSVLMYYAVV
jgi:hypothetical protein